MQFTESPASIMDIDNDGKAEVVVIPNSEKNSCCGGGGYVSLHRVALVLDGAYGNGGDPHKQITGCGMRHTGFDGVFPPQGATMTCQSCWDSTGSCGTCRVNQYYPSDSVPLVSFGDLAGTHKQILVSPFSDGYVRAFDNTGGAYFAFNYAADLGLDVQAQAVEASEVAIADLNNDGVPELIFNVFGIPTTNSAASMYLYILSNTGSKLQKIPLNVAAVQGSCSQCTAQANGCGAAGAPTVADINNDGLLEILVNTFDGRIIVWTVPGSAPNCLLWPSARGGYMRKGQPDYNYNG